MKTKVEIDTDNPEALDRAVSPSLESDEGVDIKIENGKERLRAKIQADTLGRLRGGTDATFRLTGLAKKILNR